MTPRENILVATILALLAIATPIVIFFSPVLGDWLRPASDVVGVLVFGSFGAWLVWQMLRSIMLRLGR